MMKLDNITRLDIVNMPKERSVKITFSGDNVMDSLEMDWDLLAFLKAGLEACYALTETMCSITLEKRTGEN